MIKVTLEFSSVDETIAALNKLVGAPLVNGLIGSVEGGAFTQMSTTQQPAPVAAPRRGRPPKAAAPAGTAQAPVSAHTEATPAPAAAAFGGG